jgi:probable HAF family extracellular repeat protein
MGSGFKTLVAALGMSASLAAHALATQWTAVDITPEGPGHANAVSNSGVVVGCRSVGNNVQRAYVWANGTRTDLATPQGSTSCAGVVTENGTIAGTIDDEVVIWTNGNVQRTGVKGYARDMSDDGTLVGAVEDGTANANGGKNTRAFKWANGVLTDLGAPSGFTYAIGIDRTGRIAVFSNGKLFMHENGALRDLAASVVNAYGFNDRGEIVGMTSFDHAPEPFIYDGTVRRIPGAYDFAGAVALNNMGQVLCSGEGIYGFVMEAGKLTTTDALLGGSWRHSEPDAINDRGWIVGEGGAANDFHAFVLIPKETTAPSQPPPGNGNPLMRYTPQSRPLLMVRTGTTR